ncbi:hypothetical protein HCU64_14185 [Methylobacterium sp. C25]|uniref:hypothetical protein n=1 Tax=Methylobacterium sp. C25 TaxID=2721622 RepID=UPI001F4366C6|nr:hypothetical protein [Methylobacterium sp. C25]MCE4224908.1 hypothetical protein [Methylobacterium sp. C25]
MSTIDSEHVGSYEPAAIFYGDSDCLEYVKADAFCVYERVDEFLTLVHDASGKQLVGFKLKGFRNRFNKLQASFALNDGQFAYVISAIENIYSELGDMLFADAHRAAAYKAAYQLAANDNVKVDRYELKLAA